jgi:hypothetical protein
MLVIADDPVAPRFVLAELKRRRFVRGRNLDVVVRTGTAVQMPQLVRELLASKPDVIVAISDWAVHPAKQPTVVSCRSLSAIIEGLPSRGGALRIIGFERVVRSRCAVPSPCRKCGSLGACAQ